VLTRVENALGRGSEMEPLAVRQEILDQIESQIIDDAGGRVFPFEKVVVRLQPQTKTQGDAIEEVLVQKGTLKSDILQILKDAQARYPDNLEIIIEYRLSLDPDPMESSLKSIFEIDFLKRQDLHIQSVPGIKLLIMKGLAEKSEYAMNKARILIGRSPEVLDREGRMVRRNDIVFLEIDEEINGSVGHTHARILFSHEKGEFCILDEGSRYGTRILRDGTVIEVPSGDPEGIYLQTGDDIYCGQACLRIMLT
jgi:hypothetical protein